MKQNIITLDVPTDNARYRFYEITFYLDDGRYKGNVTKQVVAKGSQKAWEALLERYSDAGVYIKHIASHELQMRDAFIL